MPRDPKLNEQMRTESRQMILLTAGRLFAQQGFFNVRIAEIARQAGMSPGNIYWYFPSKEDILKAILEEFFETHENLFRQAAESPGNALQKLRRLIELHIASLEANGEYAGVFLSILGHGGPELLKSLGFDLIAIGGRYHQHLTLLLEIAMAEGFIPVQDPRPLVVFYFSFFNGLMITYAADWKQVPGEAIVQAVFRLLQVKEKSIGEDNLSEGKMQ